MPKSENKPQGKLRLLAQVTDKCNIYCEYCVAENGSSKGTMNNATLENLTTKIFEHNASWMESEIIWHGQEPLVAGLDFYVRAIDAQRKFSDHRFINCLQTNGTLLNEEYADFFKSNGFRIGFSLDGIPSTHDKNRHYVNGKGTFDIVFKNMELARKFMIGGGGAICVVNKNTLPSLVEIYKFFKDNKINLQLNAQVNAGRAIKRPDLSITPDEYADAMISLFDIWFNDQTEPAIEVDPFSIYIQRTRQMESIFSIIGKNEAILEFVQGIAPLWNKGFLNININGACDLDNRCFYTFVSIDPTGDVYTCNRWTGINGMLLGNVNDNVSFATILEKNKDNPLAIRSREGVDDCKTCKYVTMCRGGCAYVAQVMMGSPLAKDGFCAAYQRIFSHIDLVLTNMR